MQIVEKEKRRTLNKFLKRLTLVAKKWDMDYVANSKKLIHAKINLHENISQGFSYFYDFQFTIFSFYAIHKSEILQENLTMSWLCFGFDFCPTLSR